ncbi:unnamed protein product [Protopolystoma xenopodis]|uniref:Fibronectin type-III domain-containing protein n=1 Tax=Protopolystoma xenopodis TaxID=117903 RepID=A0A3S5A0G9_9PLAT|nr:unnamed protein product [Protopolystoma xenopodis]
MHVPTAPLGPLGIDVEQTCGTIHADLAGFAQPSISPSIDFQRPKSAISSEPGVRLTWRPPKETGGLPITEYLVEQRRIGPGILGLDDWLPVMSVPPGRTFVHLPITERDLRLRSASLAYRVCAVNELGAGSPLESLVPVSLDHLAKTKMLVRRPASVHSTDEHFRRLPDAPLGPLRWELATPLGNRVTLFWKSPTLSSKSTLVDSRSLLPSHYLIEASRADTPETVWFELGRFPGSSTSAEVSILRQLLSRPEKATVSPGRSLPIEPLLFRIRAENEYGYSAPLVTRVEVTSDPKSPHAETIQPHLPAPTGGRLEARLVEDRGAYPYYEPPSIELRWPPMAVSLGTEALMHRVTTPTYQPSLLDSLSRTIPVSSLGYVVEARRVGERPWKLIASLPVGHEHFIYRPTALSSSEVAAFETFGQPRVGEFRSSDLGRLTPDVLAITEAYQFRVAAKDWHGVGAYLESDIVSWLSSAQWQPHRPSSSISTSAVPLPRVPSAAELVRPYTPLVLSSVRTPTFDRRSQFYTPSTSRPTEPDTIYLPSPEAFQVVDLRVDGPAAGSPRTSSLAGLDLIGLEHRPYSYSSSGLPSTGSVLLRWRGPTLRTGLPSFARGATTEFVVERWHPDRLHWQRVVSKPFTAPSRDSASDRFEASVDRLQLGIPHHFRIFLDTPIGRSEPVMLTQPVILPIVTTPPTKRGNISTKAL